NQNFSVKHPFDWQVIDAEGQTILWKQDEANRQLSWARAYENSATMGIAVDNNEQGLSLDSYFSGLVYDDGATIQSQELNAYPFQSVYLADTMTFDYSFELPNGAILVIY